MIEEVRNKGMIGRERMIGIGKVSWNKGRMERMTEKMVEIRNNGTCDWWRCQKSPVI